MSNLKCLFLRNSTTTQSEILWAKQNVTEQLFALDEQKTHHSIWKLIDIPVSFAFNNDNFNCCKGCSFHLFWNWTNHCDISLLSAFVRIMIIVVADAVEFEYLTTYFVVLKKMHTHILCEYVWCTEIIIHFIYACAVMQRCCWQW